MKRRAFLFPIIFIIALAVPAFAAERKGDKYRATVEKVTSLIEKGMRKDGVVGLSVALVDDQKIIFSRGFGYADKKKKIPATPDTGYRAGGIAKLFTAASALLLAERGSMDLDAPITRYLPEFSIRSRFQGGVITTRNLMTHHSGLPTNYFKGMWCKAPERFDNMVLELRDEYASFPPDHVFSYSNLGYTLLGAAVERASGVPFEAFVKSNLFAPLGMHRSDFSSKASGLPTDSKGYKKEDETEMPALRDVPTAGLNTTTADVSNFIRMIFADGAFGGAEVLSPAILRAMVTPQNLNVPLDFSFKAGLGWILSGLGDLDIKHAGPVAHIAGAPILFHSMIIILPRHKLGVIVMANTSTARELVDKAATEAIKLALEAKTGIKQPEPEEPPLADAVDSEAARRLDGEYATFAGLVRVTNNNGSLRTEFAGRKFKLVPRADGRTALRYRFMGFVPIPFGILNNVGLALTRVDGRDVLSAKLGTHEFPVGVKLGDPTPSEKWKGRAGDYEITNLGDDHQFFEKTFTLSEEHGRFHLSFEYAEAKGDAIKMLMEPAPNSPDEGIIAGLGFGTGETIRAVNIGGEEFLAYSGYRLKKRPPRRTFFR
ncbi:MAG: beta-lactamase family protein [Nitrospinae bacterium]|nr:beta-lactamase family protein [Nitrospinota bacterium]